MAAKLLMIAVWTVTALVGDVTAINKTNCDVIRGSSFCIQSPCIESPCTMQCGLTAKYGNCQQVCHSRICEVLACHASELCQQTVVQSTFANMICDAMSCRQSCSLGQCGSMKCPKSVTSCVQTFANKMSCEANSCTQSCPKGGCQMTCLMGKNTCTQGAMKGSAVMECERGACEQNCVSRGQCRMNCSSKNVTSGSCRQVCNDSNCESTVCNAAKCTQTCSYGDCNMICLPTTNVCFQRAQLGRTTLQCDGEFCQQSCSKGDCSLVCPVGVKTCEQSGAGGNITMRCQGDVCRQTCTSGICNLICSENVKECHQACSTTHGNCHFKCAAKTCELTCLGPGGSCNAVISDGNLTVRSLAFLELLLVVAFIAILNNHLILRK